MNCHDLQGGFEVRHAEHPDGVGAATAILSSAKYILPISKKCIAYGYKRQDSYTKLSENRIVLLGEQVNDNSADDVMAQLPALESQDPDSLITTHISSPEGSFTAMTATYNTM